MAGKHDRTRPGDFVEPHEVALPDADKRRLFQVDDPAVLRRLRCTDVAIYSTTPPDQADFLATTLERYLPAPAMRGATLVDASACIGGNTRAFARRFGRVMAVEVSPLHAEILRGNLDAMGAGANVTVYCGNYIDVGLRLGPVDVVFLDPPWAQADVNPATGARDLFYLLGGARSWLRDLTRGPHIFLTKLMVLKLPADYPVAQLIDDPAFLVQEVIALRDGAGRAIYTIVILSHLFPSEKNNLEPVFQRTGVRGVEHRAAPAPGRHGRPWPPAKSGAETPRSRAPRTGSRKEGGAPPTAGGLPPLADI